MELYRNNWITLNLAEMDFRTARGHKFSAIAPCECHPLASLAHGPRQGFRAFVLRYRLLPKYDFEDMQQALGGHGSKCLRVKKLDGFTGFMVKNSQEVWWIYWIYFVKIGCFHNKFWSQGMVSLIPTPVQGMGVFFQGFHDKLALAYTCKGQRNMGMCQAIG